MNITINKEEGNSLNTLNDKKKSSNKAHKKYGK